MAATSARVSLEGVLRTVQKSKHPLAPVFEAVSNAIEAIKDRQDRGWRGQGKITLVFFFSGLTPESRILQQIEISDNGIGFDDENFERFEVFFDHTKGFKNRGSGRVQFLHWAKGLEITSHFLHNGRVCRRHFICDPVNFIIEKDRSVGDQTASIGTTVSMIKFMHSKEAAKFFSALTIEEARNMIRDHFLLQLHLARVERPDAAPIIEIEFKKNGKPEKEPLQLTPDDIPKPKVGKISVPYVRVRDAKADDIEWVEQRDCAETLEWAHFKLNANELAENGVFLCSKGIAVDHLQFDRLKGLTKVTTIDGYRFLTAVHGDVLNRPENVSHAVDSFTFPTRADAEKQARELLFDPSQNFLLFDDIYEAIDREIPVIYADFYARSADLKKDVERIAREHGIPPEIVQRAPIRLNDTEEQITKKLYSKQGEALAEQNLRIRRLFDALDHLDPTSENYEAELHDKSNELLELIPLQNKQELSRYVSRRQMVAAILGKILDGKIRPPMKGRHSGKAGAHDKEGLIHDLIIRRGTTTSQPHDLWMLSEEFVHFEGCSNFRIDQIRDSNGDNLLRPISDAELEELGINPGLRQPDIFLFADEEQCVLIELKSPDVNLSEYLTQLPRYCILISNFSKKPIRRFHCYLIGEKLNPIEAGPEYSRTAWGDYVRADVPIKRFERGNWGEQIGTAHIELIKLSSIHRRALRRNKSFADRLGIGAEVLQQGDPPPAQREETQGGEVALLFARGSGRPLDATRVASNRPSGLEDDEKDAPEHDGTD